MDCTWNFIGHMPLYTHTVAITENKSMYKYMHLSSHDLVSLSGCSHDPDLTLSDDSATTPTNTIDLSSLPDGPLGKHCAVL